MRKILILGLTAIALAGCTQTVREQRATTGALLGGATGAIIGGVASNTAGGALAGGAIGAVAGGLIGAATAPSGPCYVRSRSGKLKRVTCY